MRNKSQSKLTKELTMKFSMTAQEVMANGQMMIKAMEILSDFIPGGKEEVEKAKNELIQSLSIQKDVEYGPICIRNNKGNLDIDIKSEFVQDVLNTYGENLSVVLPPLMQLLSALKTSNEKITSLQNNWFKGSPEVSTKKEKESFRVGVKRVLIDRDKILETMSKYNLSYNDAVMFLLNKM